MAGMEEKKGRMKRVQGWCSRKMGFFDVEIRAWGRFKE
jgi:hypothetical protein